MCHEVKPPFFIERYGFIEVHLQYYLMTDHKMCQLKFRDSKFGHRNTNEYKLIID